MELKTAIRLIQEGISGRDPQTWADLGAGSGLFSKALGMLLSAGSSIYAIDRNADALAGIRWSQTDKTLIRIHQNVEVDLSLPPLDGIVLANVMHYVANQQDFLSRLTTHLNERGVFVVVEYDTTAANPWVPYPISSIALKKLATAIGYDVRILETEPSKFNTGDLYSALLSRQEPPGQ